ncbi:MULTISPECIES: Hsp33 family molecular chaperone HslO [Psychrilyobacter]|uniref:33 kDa chaperonin n=1 Tax=Psychrilyobacter piezotolerans TaxID=2293438 RepID=A0ABX9KG34_9FUSO|nr:MULTISPECIES: Hsp33 family molecular chaperone HslO [Psychrilyobacter]MCS5420479.1 Hsp33 family molecular chaperone HslO [Psychrilyobacter sp. S5]NDI78256.1 Hsp33 family molecular chaperone HslO [Psychrilyobacter piezotolerans]RDE61186.1 Hsp33 family molecular chaperone HslO [Psychrilyobacter sp. S5]REI40854.1 Hsp33 family molecular chaperone HslO [Psychrilyobacter piezotolerans]
MGKLLRGSSKNARFFIVDTKDIVQEALDIHKCSPTAIKAFGRLLTGSVMMGATLKGDDLLTIRTNTDGLLNQMLVTNDAKGNVKGYLSNPEVDLELKDGEIPKVGDLVGRGTLTVIKDMGLKEPYVGVSQMVNGEIGEDIAYYYYTSEQTPSVVVLGVSLGPDMRVKNAGGYMIQLLPDASDNFITKLEAKIKAMRPMTELLAGGMSLKRIAKLIYEDMDSENDLALIEDYNIYEEKKISYECNCNKDKFYKGLITIRREELEEIFTEKPELEVECHFCRKKYSFTKDELLG